MKKKNNSHHKITKLYIANRAEIALRIQRTASKMGIPCCVGVSECDKELSFAQKVDQTVEIGPSPAHLSYLSIDNVIAAAKRMKCNAVHPGYGFLSENAEFAARVMSEGMIWVGPSPESIRLMGSKIEGRARAKEAKVPIVPGTKGGLTDAELIKSAKEIGFPLIIKAVAGGGGRGMRVIRSIDELKELLPRARGEALKNFSSDQIFLERFIEKPRHVEVQLLGDMHGTIIHLGTRDCSAQRRHQKLIEEAPAPFLSNKLREKIHRAAIAAARSVDYYSTGTAEFLVENEKFYFLEMNTRIQVEHPVTEYITGLDLIEQQLRVAQGEKLTLTQKKVKFKGHAIEFRINAEDPREQFSPTTGEITELILPKPEQDEIRNDFGFQSGDLISVHYDGLIGKLIVYGESRHQAIQRSVRALAQLVVSGFETNLDFHRWLIRTRVFNQDGIDIAFVGREFNARCLDDLAAAELKDPELQKQGYLPQGAESIECVNALVKGRRYQLYISQREDGLFIVTGSDKKSKKIGSNSKRAALEAYLQTLEKPTLHKTKTHSKR